MRDANYGEPTEEGTTTVRPGARQEGQRRGRWGKAGMCVTIELPRHRLSVPMVRHIVKHSLSDLGVLPELIDDVEIGVSEACTNVIDHTDRGTSYRVELRITASLCELQITDTGPGFDFRSATDEALASDRERGRGLAIVRAVMDRVDFESKPETGTLVTMVKRLEFEAGSAARALIE